MVSPFRHRCSRSVNRYALAPFPASEPRSYPRKLEREVAVMSRAKIASSWGVSFDGNERGLTLMGMPLLLAGVNMAILAFSKNSSCIAKGIPWLSISSGSPFRAREEMSPWGSTMTTGMPWRTASSIIHLQSTVLPEPLAPRAIKWR